MVTENLLQPIAPLALPVIINTVEKENYTIRLRGNDNTASQLEWINKSVLTFPTAVIYKIYPANKGIDGAELIGRIEARGTYRFELKPDSLNAYHFLLYDFIHRQIIDTIRFDEEGNHKNSR